jgi:hypothetical protein
MGTNALLDFARSSQDSRRGHVVMLKMGSATTSRGVERMHHLWSHQRTDVAVDILVFKDHRGVRQWYTR